MHVVLIRVPTLIAFSNSLFFPVRRQIFPVQIYMVCDYYIHISFLADLSSFKKKLGFFGVIFPVFPVQWVPCLIHYKTCCWWEGKGYPPGFIEDDFPVQADPDLRYRTQVFWLRWLLILRAVLWSLLRGGRGGGDGLRVLLHHVLLLLGHLGRPAIADNTPRIVLRLRLDFLSQLLEPLLLCQRRPEEWSQCDEKQLSQSPRWVIFTKMFHNTNTCVLKSTC